MSSTINSSIGELLHSLDFVLLPLEEEAVPEALYIVDSLDVGDGLELVITLDNMGRTDDDQLASSFTADSGSQASSSADQSENVVLRHERRFQMSRTERSQISYLVASWLVKLVQGIKALFSADRRGRRL